MDTKECGLWQRPERAGGNLVLASCGVGGGIQTVFTRYSRGRLAVGAPPRGAVVAPLSTPRAPASAGTRGVLERVKRGPGSWRAGRAEEGPARSRSPLPGAGTGGGAGSRSSPEAARPCARAPGGGCGRSRPRGSKPRRAPLLGAAGPPRTRVSAQTPPPSPRRAGGARFPGDDGAGGTRRPGLGRAEGPRALGKQPEGHWALAGAQEGEEGSWALTGAREGAEDPPGHTHGRAGRAGRPPRRSTARGKMLGNPRGARTGAREAAAPPPSALTGAREEARAHARRRPPTWAPRPGSGGRGGGGRVAERRGRGGPRGRKAVEKRPRRRRTGEARVGRGGCRRGGGGLGWPCSRWRCGQRGGLTSVSSRGRPRGGGRPIRGDSAGRGWPPPAGRAGGGGGGWDSGAALDPEDHEPPRCPHGDRLRGNSSSAGVVGGGARSPWPRLRLAQPGVRAFLGAGPGLRAAPPKRVVRGASGSGREVPRGPGDAEGRAPRPPAPRCFSSLRRYAPSGRPSGPQAPRGLRPPPLPAVARGSLGEGGPLGQCAAGAPFSRSLCPRTEPEPGRAVPALVACANVPDITMWRGMTAARNRLALRHRLLHVWRGV